MAITVNGKKKIDYGNPQTTVTKSNNYESEVARILNNSGVSTAGLNLRNTSPAQKTSVTAADTYFNSANLNNPNPGTYAVGADGNAPRGLGVGDTVSTAGGNYEITNALAPGANYNANTGYWSRRTTDNYGVPLETGGNYNFEQRPQGYTKPAYTSQWQQDINNAVAQLLGYDFDTYKQGSEYAGLERDYTRLGQRAMDDTLGKVAARTGGMASSYAGYVGQEAYSNYLQQLEEAARQHYQQERGNRQDMVNLLMSLEGQDYDKYRDLLAQYNTDRGFDYGSFSDAYNRQYQQGRDKIADERYADETAYDRQQTADAQARQTELERAQLMAQVGDYSGLAAAYNLPTETVDAMVKEYARQKGIEEWQAAAEVADWYAKYGDWSKVGDMGVNTSYQQALQRYDLLSKFGLIPEYWSWRGGTGAGTDATLLNSELGAIAGVGGTSGGGSSGGGSSSGSRGSGKGKGSSSGGGYVYNDTGGGDDEVGGGDPYDSIKAAARASVNQGVENGGVPAPAQTTEQTGSSATRPTMKQNFAYSLAVQEISKYSDTTQGKNAASQLLTGYVLNGVLDPADAKVIQAKLGLPG